MILYLFTCIQPFRRTLLSMLAPSDISRLLTATRCTVTATERGSHMNVLDDIFKDSSSITAMQKSRLTVRLFGSDLQILEGRLLQPYTHVQHQERHRALHIFVLVTSVSDGLPTLVHDYRPDSEHGFVPDDMEFTQLEDAFDHNVALQIAAFSSFILCAPYLTGTMPNAVPGWIPLFNAQPFVNVRAYISTFAERNGRILHMNRTLMNHVFGYKDNRYALSMLLDSTTTCYRFENGFREVVCVEGKLTMNMMHNVLLKAVENPRKYNDKYIVVNTLHPLNTSITLDIA
jgi:hypothetical protein